MKNSHQKHKSNRNILILTYVFVGLFLCMAGYFAYFLQFRSEDVINNSYNARLDRFSDRIVRGEILSSNKTVLARTITDKNGKETREYPYQQLFSHAVGYSISRGKTGVEAVGNFYLLSSHVNLIEKIIKELSNEKNIGDNVVTTLDMELQQIAYDALGDRRGAVVVMEPDTGKILAMVSKPDFNPNTLEQDWESLVASENTGAQLLNRSTQGLYPPGSTFKILTLLAYIRENPDTYTDFHFDCDGVYENGDYRIKCYHSTAHGSQDLRAAFANSCNGAFASMGLELDLVAFSALADQFLFGAPLPLALPYNKSTYQMGADADTWEILQTSMGQGATQMTPMHNLMIISAIANGGTLMKPYLIDYVENGGGQVIQKFMPTSYGNLLSAEEAQLLGEYLRAVVTEGTGSALRTDSYEVAGKTGSAEFETGKDSHSWFVGYAPYQDPKLAVCVLVEESGSGGQVAAPIARKLFDQYFSR